VEPADERLRPKQVSELTGLSLKTLANRRSAGLGPPWAKAPRSNVVTYSRAGLMCWLSDDREGEAA
jgi:hypothetical protein